MKVKIKMVMANTVTRRNPVAAALATGQFRAKVVPNKRAYRRRDRNTKSWE